MLTCFRGGSGTRTSGVPNAIPSKSEPHFVRFAGLRRVALPPYDALPLGGLKQANLPLLEYYHCPLKPFGLAHLQEQFSSFGGLEDAVPFRDNFSDYVFQQGMPIYGFPVDFVTKRDTLGLSRALPGTLPAPEKTFLWGVPGTLF